MQPSDREYVEWHQWDQHDEESWHADGLDEIDSFYQTPDASEIEQEEINATAKNDTAELNKLNHPLLCEHSTHRRSASSPRINHEYHKTRPDETTAHDDPDRTSDDLNVDFMDGPAAMGPTFQSKTCLASAHRDLEAAKTLLSIPHAEPRANLAISSSARYEHFACLPPRDIREAGIAESAMAMEFTSSCCSPVAPAFEPLSPPLRRLPLPTMAFNGSPPGRAVSHTTPPMPPRVIPAEPQTPPRHSRSPDILIYGPDPLTSPASGKNLLRQEMYNEDIRNGHFHSTNVKPFALATPARCCRPTEPFNDKDNPSIPVLRPFVRLSHEGRKSLCATPSSASSNPGQVQTYNKATSAKGHMPQANVTVKPDPDETRISLPPDILTCCPAEEQKKANAAAQQREPTSAAVSTNGNTQNVKTARKLLTAEVPTFPLNASPLVPARIVPYSPARPVREAVFVSGDVTRDNSGKSTSKSGAAKCPPDGIISEPSQHASNPLMQDPRDVAASKRLFGPIVLAKDEYLDANGDSSGALSNELAKDTVMAQKIGPSEQRKLSSPLLSPDTASTSSSLTTLASEDEGTPISAIQPPAKGEKAGKKRPSSKRVAKPAPTQGRGPKRGAVGFRELGDMLGVMGDEGLKQQLVGWGGSPRATRNTRKTRGMAKEEAAEKAKEFKATAAAKKRPATATNAVDVRKTKKVQDQEVMEISSQ